LRQRGIDDGAVEVLHEHRAGDDQGDPPRTRFKARRGAHGLRHLKASASSIVLQVSANPQRMIQKKASRFSEGIAHNQ